jgi:hypothetical protein
MLDEGDPNAEVHNPSCGSTSFWVRDISHAQGIKNRRLPKDITVGYSG